MNPRRPGHPPDAPRDGLSGNSGSRSGQELLAALRGWLGSGTLALAQAHHHAGVRVLRGCALISLDAGEVTGRHMLGRFGGLAAADLDLHAVTHASSALPRLPSVAPDAELGPARALPRLVASHRVLPGLDDVKPLLARLAQAGWHGALLGRSPLGTALAVLLEGRVVAASGRRGAAVGTGAALATLAFVFRGVADAAGVDVLAALSPFSWLLANEPLENGLPALDALRLAGLTVVAAPLGVARFVRRDLMA